MEARIKYGVMMISLRASYHKYQYFPEMPFVLFFFKESERVYHQ